MHVATLYCQCIAWLQAMLAWLELITTDDLALCGDTFITAIHWMRALNDPSANDGDTSPGGATPT